MANLTSNLELIRSTLGPLVADEWQKIVDGINTMAQQTNANPIGQVEAPPQISAVTVTPKGGGVHQITIQDNTPINRGLAYFAEYSTDPSFSTWSTVPMGPSRQLDVPAGTGNLYWRSYSAYPTGPSSPPVYHGGGVPAAVNSTGATANAALGIPGTGSGTEPSLNPQGGAGFGFEDSRVPRIPGE